MADVHLSNTDSFTVHQEQDPLFRSTIVAIVLLDRTPDWERLCAAIDRATRLEPNFRRRLIPGNGPLVPARWVDDPAFDLSWHLRRVAVPAPHDVATVLDFARIAGMTAFDPIRPRWEFTIMEGMHDGGAALVMKVHHALTDGIGGIQLAMHVVDLDRKGSKRRHIPMPPAGPSDDLVERASDAVTYDLRRLGDAAAGVVRAVPGVVADWARHPFGFWGEVGRGVASVGRVVRPNTTTLSPVMTHRRLGWRYQTLVVPLEPLKSVAKMAGGTVNDGFLAGLAGGLALYHRRHGAGIEELRVTMPISTRTDGDGPGGNHITLMRFPVPLGDHDPVSRMMEIDRTCTELRHEPAIGWTQAIAGVLNLLPTGVASGMLKHVDVLASNVPGFDAPVFIAGARAEEFFAFGPTLGASANITLMSYRGQCFMGVTTDTGAVPDPGMFLECLAEGFAELLSIYVER